MTYSILQKSLDAPAVEKLKRAFKGKRGLTSADAHTIANDAFGILLKNLPEADAVALVQALAAEGIESHLVREDQLIPLPPAKFVRRIECTSEALMIFDPLNRSFPLEWRHILLIAAGTVRVEGIIRPRADRSRPSLAFGMADLPVDAPLSRRFENRDEEWLLEIILQRAVLRYSLQVEPVMLQLSPGNTAGADDAANFALLVQTLCRQAPRAVVNRGAHFFREDREEKFRYPSRNAFHEEMVWLLWRLAKPPAEGA